MHTQTDSQEHSYRRSLAILAILTCVILVGVAIRWFYLSSAAYVGDEFYTVSDYEARRFRLLNPAYYQLVYLSVRVFGETPMAFRLPAFLLGAATLPMLFFLMRRFFGNAPALIATVILALNTWHVFHSQNARFYTGVVLFLLLALYAYLEAIRTGRLSRLVFHFVAGLIATTFHATAAFVMVAFWIVSGGLLAASRPLSLPPLSRRIAKFHVGLGVAAAAVVLPISWYLLSELQLTARTWGRPGFGMLMQTFNMIGPVVVVAAIGGTFLLLKRDRLMAIVLAGVSGLTVGVSFLLSFYVPIRPDYFIGVLAIVCMLAGILGGCALYNAKSLGPVTWVAVFAVASLPSIVSHVNTHLTYSIRDVVTYLDERFEPGDTVMALVPGVPFYSNIDQSAIQNIPGSPFSNRVDWEGLFNEHAQAAKRTWVVVPIRRRDIADKLFDQLACSTQLVWRKRARRLDYSDFGAEIFVADWTQMQTTTGTCARREGDGSG
jgi:hypothetical protein